ncbi:hypothetical protein ACFX2B_030573 [Malus domestica]
MRFTSIWSVNDLAFCNPVMQLCAITCGDDKAIKVWNATTGSKLYTFEGHDTPVHSVCPHNKQNVNFFFSTSVNGKIKAWLYNNMGYQVDYDASDHSITMMAYGADGKRLVNHSFQMLLRPTPIFQATRKFNLYIKRNAGSFRAGQVKMENLMLLNGMKMMV